MSSALTTLLAGPFPTGELNMTLAGKVIGVHATATTYVLVPYNDGGFLLSDSQTTVTVGPWASVTTTGDYDAYWTETNGLNEGSADITMSLHCQMSGRTPLACTQQMRDVTTSTKETITGKDLTEAIPIFNQATVHITDGQDLLPASTSVSDGASTTLDSTAKAQSTPTGSSGSQKTGSADSPSGAFSSSRSILASIGLAAVAMVAIWL
ncbi:hypothetical protein FGRMN_4552 [Fusarium graminum]|nr:hypothetical protein FGRMN_4552 [Fusarium graminum]